MLASGVGPAQFLRLVRLGIVEPANLTTSSAARLRRMLRLQRDLGVNPAGAAIILDLVDRLDRLEAELAELRARPLPVPMSERRVAWIPTG